MTIRAGVFVTVAICTYNRCESLAETLDTLVAQQRADAADWQVLIVDNNCSDATLRVISGFAGRIGVRVVRETRQGLSHARNRALREARGEWVVFIDDDVKLASLWLASWIAALRGAPEAAYAGARILPDWGGAPPAWFHGEKLALIDGALGWFDLGEGVRPFRDDDPTPFGGNMAIRRQMALSLNGFRADLGMKGEELGRGEETDLFLRARRKGAGGLYVGNGAVSTPHRTRTSYPAGVVSLRRRQRPRPSRDCRSQSLRQLESERGLFREGGGAASQRPRRPLPPMHASTRGSRRAWRRMCFMIRVNETTIRGPA